MPVWRRREGPVSLTAWHRQSSTQFHGRARPSCLRRRGRQPRRRCRTWCELWRSERCEELRVVVPRAVHPGAHRPCVKRTVVRRAGEREQPLRGRPRVQPLVERRVRDDHGLSVVDLGERSSIAGHSPARVYLVRAGVWPADPQIPLPVAVRWVPHRLLKRILPSGAAGAVMFSAWRAGELPRGLARALVLRPLTLFGEPVGERVVVGDSSGAVFEPQDAVQGGAIHLCEHELDALALVRSGVTGPVRAPAVSAWRVSLADDAYGRPVVVHARSPAPAERFKARLKAAGRTCTVRPPPFVPALLNG